jgi:hypothetical protein
MRNILMGMVALFSVVTWAAGDAGCGLGSLVMQKNSKVSQILAMTTNGTFSSQLFGITSGTSNCSSNAIVKNKSEAIRYAEANFENLKIDMARGQGESIFSVGSLLGCQGQSLVEFSRMTQKNFSEIVPENAAPAQVIDALDQKIKNDQNLFSGCQIAV